MIRFVLSVLLLVFSIVSMTVGLTPAYSMVALLVGGSLGVWSLMDYIESLPEGMVY